MDNILRTATPRRRSTLTNLDRALLRLSALVHGYRLSLGPDHPDRARLQEIGQALHDVYAEVQRR